MQVFLSILALVVFGVYFCTAWWAVNRTIFYNYTMVGSYGAIIGTKAVAAIVLGVILIPIAIILKATGRR